MFDYSDRIEAFRDKKVRLSSDFYDKLLGHRKANRDRLISRLPDYIKGVMIGESSFRPQGSFAMQTVIQTRFADEEYDIDDGIVFWKHQLVKSDGTALSPMQVKEKVRQALQDERFNRQPKLCTNCVRVFYADTDEEKHHVDFPVYRKYDNAEGKRVRELASADEWVLSDPTQVNTWFDDLISERNESRADWGTQLRRLIQLLKRFCRTRREWDLPNGMKLTMLAAECQPHYRGRIDAAFRELLTNIEARLQSSKVIRNLAHPEQPAITRSDADDNVAELQKRAQEAMQQFTSLDDPSADADSARKVWDWILRSDGFFAEFDAEKEKQEQKQKVLMEKAALIRSGAKTSPAGVVGSVGISNLRHEFYGEEIPDQSEPRI